MPLIEAQELVKHYVMGDVTVEALRGVSLKIEPRDFVVIVGPSGSGKSTLMHLLGALDHPTSGKVLIDEIDISGLDDWHLAMIRRNKIGFIFQQFNLIPTLSALENVVIPTEPMDIDKEEAENRAASLLRDVGLADRMFHKPNELSGGQRQRVSIARSLINNPEIIFADEPTGNLDSKTGAHIIKLMRELNQNQGKTFVIVTHDESLLRYASKKIFIRDGKIASVEKGKLE
jgi:putative ABC transport system ATP-binding protein